MSETGLDFALGEMAMVSTFVAFTAYTRLGLPYPVAFVVALVFAALAVMIWVVSEPTPMSWSPLFSTAMTRPPMTEPTTVPAVSAASRPSATVPFAWSTTFPAAPFGSFRVPNAVSASLPTGFFGAT